MIFNCHVALEVDVERCTVKSIVCPYLRHHLMGAIVLFHCHMEFLNRHRAIALFPIDCGLTYNEKVLDL